MIYTGFFFVVFSFLFICGFYVWFQSIADILINRFLRFSDSGYLLNFFSLNDLVRSYPVVLINLTNCIYIILSIIAWSRLKIKIMPKA
ncbi:hypothetical protein CQA69_02300 [Campylobacter estrildidarum]|uniref:Uncharacterized protein n=1 Tax=Campylobacter estrildidarum TaxID=2510189 RepID=A0A4U7BT47_9BACT|nr:hypothetical protein CQA69_02300 [Campylobacter estrildidarum]